jgi:hypothetical protein
VVGEDVELAQEVPRVGLEVTIRDEVGLEVDEGVEVGLVVAVVESVGESNLECVLMEREREVGVG